MAEKTTADVLIGGKVYTLCGYEDEAYYPKVASYINNKMQEVSSVEGFKRFSLEMKSVLVHLNIADDYFKIKDLLEKLELDMEFKEQELYGLNQDLTESQMKAELLEAEKQELEEKNQELELAIAKLEAELKEVKAEKQLYKKM